jgi:hypothetical protein
MKDQKQQKKATSKKTVSVRKNSGPTKAGKKSSASFLKKGVRVASVEMRVPWSEQATQEDLDRLRKYSQQEREEKQMWASLDENTKGEFRRMFS